MQVYKRAKYFVDNQMQVIFYWDMGNDVKPAHQYSLARWCNYGLSSNVDSLVTEVRVNHPTGIHEAGLKPVQPKNDATYDLQGRRLSPTADRHRGIIIRNGRKQITF